MLIPDKFVPLAISLVFFTLLLRLIIGLLPAAYKQAHGFKAPFSQHPDPTHGIFSPGAKKLILAVSIVVIVAAFGATVYSFAFSFPNQPTNADKSASALSPDLHPGISSIELFGTENGISYYDVYLSAGFNWDSARLPDKEAVVESAIQYCEKESSRCHITGFTEDGYTAFAWEGGNTVKMFKGGRRGIDYIRP